MKLCECGCDKEVSKDSNRFISGHNAKITLLGNKNGRGKRSKEFCENISLIKKEKYGQNIFRSC